MDEASTINQPPDTTSGRSTSEADALAGYKTLSPAALLGLLLGIASPLVFVGALLKAVPLFGIAISLVALAKISRSEGQLVGRSAALAGLGLAVICLSAAETRTWTAHWKLARQSLPVAEQWFAHLQAGEPAKAFHLTVDAARAATTQTEDLPPGTEMPSAASFAEQPLVKQLLALGENATVRHAAVVDAQLASGHRAFAVHEFRVDGSGAAGTNTPRSVEITLEQRGQGSDGKSPPWRVAGFQSPTTGD